MAGYSGGIGYVPSGIGSGGGGGGGGATITVTVSTVSNIDLSSAPTTIDGYTPSIGDTVLVKTQTPDTGTGNPDNGLYVWNGTGSAMTRLTGYTTWEAFISLTVKIQNGDTYAGSSWANSASAGGTLGVTNLSFSELPSVLNFTNGVTQSGTNVTLTTAVAPANQFANGVTGGDIVYRRPAFSDLLGVGTIVQGGTGQSTANAAFNALAPSQTSQAGKVLQTDGTNTSWQTVSSGAVYPAKIAWVASNGTDGTAINLTIDGAIAYLAGSGTIMIAPGTFNMPSSSLNNYVLWGSDPINTIIQATTGSTFPVSDGDKIVITNIQFKGISTNVTPVIISSKSANITWNNTLFTAYSTGTVSLSVTNWGGNMIFNNLNANKNITMGGAIGGGEITINYGIFNIDVTTFSGALSTVICNNCDLTIVNYSGGGLILNNPTFTNDSTFSAIKHNNNYVHIIDGTSQYSYSTSLYRKLSFLNDGAFNIINCNTDNNNNDFGTDANGLIIGDNNLIKNITLNYQLKGYEGGKSDAIIRADCRNAEVSGQLIIDLYPIANYGEECQSIIYQFQKTDTTNARLIIRCNGGDTMINSTSGSSTLDETTTQYGIFCITPIVGGGTGVSGNGWLRKFTL